jgi:hypothetical protein
MRLTRFEPALRARRLEAIALQLNDLTAALGKLELGFAEYAQQQERAAAEWRDAPVAPQTI